MGRIVKDSSTAVAVARCATGRASWAALGVAVFLACAAAAPARAQGVDFSLGPVDSAAAVADAAVDSVAAHAPSRRSSERSRCAWLTSAGGFGSGDEADLLLAGMYEFAFLDGHNLYSIRASGLVEFLDWESVGYVWDAGVLYGRAAKGRFGLASASVGLGIVGKSGDGYTPSGKRRETRALGIPCEAQLLLTPTPLVGIGAQYIADINSERMFHAIMFSVVIGKLW